MQQRISTNRGTQLPWDDGNHSSSREEEVTIADARRRLRWFVSAFAIALIAIFSRQISLEWREGATYRKVAAEPLVRRQSVPGLRGRILARDGTLLAEDRQHPALAVHYRYIEQPTNPTWLRAQARKRLTHAERRDPLRVEAAQAQVRQDIAHLNQQLASLCNLSPEDWQARCDLVGRRVSSIAQSVNARRKEPSATAAPPTIRNWRDWLAALLAPAPDVGGSEAARIVVAEEVSPHVLVDVLPLEVVSELETHPERYPGVQIVLQSRRVYPRGALAAHVLGHVGPLTAQEADDQSVELTASDVVGRAGIERQHNDWLRGSAGQRVIRTRRDGQEISRQIEQEPTVGHDLLLTLDPILQQAAQELLDQGMARAKSLLRQRPDSAGGALLVLDVHTGELLAAASAPHFDPNQFVSPSSEQAAAWLVDPAKPLFDRTRQMAIAPGSLFKIVSAIALLESGTLAATDTYDCQGYWQRPDRLRCAIFARTGHGHGPLDLAAALTQSCNTYFFAGAAALDPAQLTQWARDFGLSQSTGIDLPAEAPGQIPDATQATWRLADTQALSIGQSTLLVTPLQIARVMAAIANGGTLVRPHVVRSAIDSAATESFPEQFLESLGDQSLLAVQQALGQVVASPQGTAHALADLDVAVAGKTGTAQVGSDLPEHAWFAGYAPTHAPQYAFVVVLEHAGNASQTAVPVARSLIESMVRLGQFREPDHWAQSPKNGARRR
jgi:penicillin-binding protein 2